MAARIFYLIHGSALKETRVADRLRERGVAITWCSHLDGDPLPDDLSAFDGVVVGGGSDSVNAAPRLPYMARELAWVRRTVEGGTPYFGICLGAQLLASAFGARVGPRADARGECGYHPIAATTEGEALFGGLTAAYSFHGEGVEAPAGAVVLARSPDFPVHAFRLGASTYGVQFHPDYRPDLIRHWCAFAPEMMALPGAQPMEEQLDAAPRHDPGLSHWLDRFLDHWPGAVRSGAVD